MEKHDYEQLVQTLGESYPDKFVSESRIFSTIHRGKSSLSALAAESPNTLLKH